MNSDIQHEGAISVDARVLRLFFEDHKNTAEIATILGWHEAAVDRRLSSLLDSLHTLRPELKFRIGDRVRLNAHARSMYRSGMHSRVGSIVRLNVSPKIVMVLWDGLKTPQAWSIRLLDLVDGELTEAEQSDNAKRGYELAIQTLREPITAQIELFSVSRATKNPHHIGFWWRLRTGCRSVKDNHGPFVSTEAALADAEQALGTREPMGAAQKPE